MGMDHNGAIDACECEDCQRRRGWLDELERLEREATPFPWEPVPGHGVIESPTHVVESGYRSEVNVRLIAALRNHARDLIEAARRCEELGRALGIVAGYALTAQRHNTREWMFGMEDAINRAAALVGDPDRAVCDSDGMRMWLKKGGES
jgi:hypothetical protein